MKLNVVIFCLLFCYVSIIVTVKSEEGPCPAEKRVVRSTVQEYVEEKIEEGFAKVSSSTVIFPSKVVSCISTFQFWPKIKEEMKSIMDEMFKAKLSVEAGKNYFYFFAFKNSKSSVKLT